MMPSHATLCRSTLMAVARELRLAIVCVEALKRTEPPSRGDTRPIDAFDAAHATRTLWLIEKELQRSREGQPRSPVSRADAGIGGTTGVRRAPERAKPRAATGPRQQVSLPDEALPLSGFFRQRLARALAALSSEASR